MDEGVDKDVESNYSTVEFLNKERNRKSNLQKLDEVPMNMLGVDKANSEFNILNAT